jgi:endonuclease/exonuclease/phosphatase family metal-dependent hydrolase
MLKWKAIRRRRREDSPVDDCKRFVLIHLETFAPKFSEEYTVVPEEGRNAIPIILAGDLNIELKKKKIKAL